MFEFAALSTRIESTHCQGSVYGCVPYASLHGAEVDTQEQRYALLNLTGTTCVVIPCEQ